MDAFIKSGIFDGDKKIYDEIMNPFNSNDKRNRALPMEFNPINYKTIECPLGDYCKLDGKLCLNYHSVNDRRRDYLRYSYKGMVCENVFINGKFIPSKSCLKV